MSFSRGSSESRDQTRISCVSCITEGFLGNQKDSMAGVLSRRGKGPGDINGWIILDFGNHIHYDLIDDTSFQLIF